MEYFDLKTMKAGNLKKIDDETWFHSQDGIDSRRVEEEDLLLPYDAFKEFLNVVRSTAPALQQNCNNVATELQQNCNNVAADIQQNCSRHTAQKMQEISKDLIRPLKNYAPCMLMRCVS